jgi:hypothetical protein
MGNNPFISHRMFVAALNNDNHPPATPANGAPPARVTGPRSVPPPSQLTVQQLAAFAAHYWPEFPFARSMEQSSS